MKNEAAPIKNAGNSNPVWLNFMLAPATRASILVAIPIEIRHLRPMQHIFSSFCSNASNINFNPKIKNIAKEIQAEYAET